MLSPKRGMCGCGEDEAAPIVVPLLMRAPTGLDERDSWRHALFCPQKRPPPLILIIRNIRASCHFFREPKQGQLHVICDIDDSWKLNVKNNVLFYFNCCVNLIRRRDCGLLITTNKNEAVQYFKREYLQLN